jgi:hypothetical protein
MAELLVLGKKEKRMEDENVFAEEKRLKQLEQENKEKRQRRIDNLSEKYSTVDLDSALIEIAVLEKSVRFLKGGLTPHIQVRGLKRNGSRPAGRSTSRPVGRSILRT